jgi:hypothetical protein
MDAASLFPLVSLLALVSAQFCPQASFGALSNPLIPGAGKVRRPFDRATNQPGFDIVAWTHDGVTSILGTNAPATGPAELVGASGTTISSAFSSNGAGGAFASLEDLEANGDEWIIVAAKVAVDDGDGPTIVANASLVEFGGSQKLTIRCNGEWFFGATRGFIATGFSMAETNLVFTFRRFASNGEIRVSFLNATARGTGIARVDNIDGTDDLAASLFDISAGSVVWNGPPATASTTVDNLLVFYGRGNLQTDAGDIITAFRAQAATNAFDACVFERWETVGSGIGATCSKVGFAVPGCGNDNLKLTWKKTNFQSTAVLTGGNVSVAWNANPNFISNFSAVAGAGAKLWGFTGPSMSVPLRAGAGHGASQSIEFTATVFASAPQALPRVGTVSDPVDATSPDQIFVGTNVAEIFLLRLSLSTLSTTNAMTTTAATAAVSNEPTTITDANEPSTSADPETSVIDGSSTTREETVRAVSGGVTDASKDETNHQPSTDIGSIIGGVIGAVTAVVLLIAFCLGLWKFFVRNGKREDVESSDMSVPMARNRAGAAIRGARKKRFLRR